ncbi:MAG: hypothetical protein EBW15_06910 [Actinobacteria bacterium]|nr:hypothetical protein [Actinomycetota bacterium]
MRRIQPNLFDDYKGLYRRSANGITYFATTFNPVWDVDSPATLQVVDDVFRSARRFSLRLTNSTALPIHLTVTQDKIEQPYGSLNLLFNAMILCDVQTTVSVYLHSPDVLHESVEPNVQVTTPGVWSPIFSNEAILGAVQDAEVSASVTIIINSNSTLPVFFTSPHLTHADPDLFNQFAILSQRFFPDILRDIDSQQVNPSRPLMKLYHSLTAHASMVMDEYVRIIPFDNDEVGPSDLLLEDEPRNILSRSEMTDPLLMSKEYMQWAAMFIGTRILADIQVAGNSVFEDESFEFDRWQVVSRAYGVASGNKDSIKDAIRNILTGTRGVLVTPLWDGDPWTIMIRTLTTETPGVAAEGDTSLQVLAVAEPARPAGYEFLHTAVDNITFILNDPDFGVFDQNVLG